MRGNGEGLTVGIRPRYYVKCLNANDPDIDTYLGTYRVGVNYYDGEGAETARVQISVNGSEVVRTFSQSLSSDRGSEGDNSPISVAQVIISKDGNELKYEIVR